jgi:hypothetical protein
MQEAGSMTAAPVACSIVELGRFSSSWMKARNIRD